MTYSGPAGHLTSSRQHRLLILGFIAAICIMTVSSASPGTIMVPEDHATIQAAIQAASNGDLVLVSPGTYVESINFQGKGIIVRSVHGPQTTIITNDRTNDLVTFDHGEMNDAVFDGFTLKGGWIGLHIVNSAPVIKHNIFVDQNVTCWAAIAISGPCRRWIDGRGNPIYEPTYGTAPAIIVNNTIVGSANGGLSVFSLASPTIRNNIIAFNGHYGIHIQTEGDVDPALIGYNCVYGQGAPVPNQAVGDYINVANAGIGSISSDPLFARHSTVSHDSPCVDAGDPDPTYNDPDGSRNDMGAVPYFLAPGDCCAGRVGDVNFVGDDEPTISDVSAIIDAKFITGSCSDICVGEADINQSGGAAPACDDVTISDVAALIDYLFITGQSLGLPDCP